MLHQHQLWATDERPKQPLRPAASGQHADSGAREPRILIVEDEFFVAWDLQSMVRDLGYAACEVASDAHAAIERAIESEANLLLMDINLGEGPDGIEVVRRIREYRDVAVIFITAYTDQRSLKNIDRVAPEAPVLMKPVLPQALRAAISRVFPAPRG